MPKVTMRLVSYRTKAGGVAEARLGADLDGKDMAEGQLDRLKALGAFDEQGAAAPAPEPVGVDEMDDEQLDAFVSDTSIPKLVAAADGDPARAQRILDAEGRSRQGDEREGLVKELSKVIDG